MNMELTYIIPEMTQTFGTLEYAGEGKVEQRRLNGKVMLASRSYNLYSTVQRADDIIVVLPAEAGEKHFDYNDEVELINPVANTVATPTYRGADLDWYMKAEDLVLKKKAAPVHDKPRKEQR